MLGPQTKPVLVDPRYLCLNDEERIFLVGQREKQGESHVDLDRLVASNTQSSPRHVDDRAIARDDVGGIHPRIHQAKREGDAIDPASFSRGAVEKSWCLQDRLQFHRRILSRRDGRCGLGTVKEGIHPVHRPDLLRRELHAAPVPAYPEHPNLGNAERVV